MNQRERISKWRVGSVMFMLGASSLLLVGKIAHIQLVEHADFAMQADDNHWGKQLLMAPRGAVRDRNGNPLAMSINRWELSIDPSQLEKPGAREAAINIATKATGLSFSDIEKKLAGATKAVVISDQVDYAQGKPIAETGLPGVRVKELVTRAFPEGALASTLVGFLGKDHFGLTGVERDFDRDLAGVPGHTRFERDSIGNPIPLGYRTTVNPKPGGDIYLTIDRYIQRVVERQLDDTLKEQKAEGGTVIVMEPDTGAILAMASRPSFDVRKLDFSDPKTMELIRNRAITDLYEPGSTFKSMTMAAALNEKLVTPETTHNDNGPVVKYGGAISNWNFVHVGVETMTQLLVRSNNVGAVWVAEKLGTEKMYNYINRFGFGQPTNIGLSGEASGFYRTPKDPAWTPIDLATSAYGQSVTVTPIQLITAYAAIANGGTLMRPYVVDRVVTPERSRLTQPIAVRQVIGADTARTMRTMLKQVAEEGTAGKGTVPGFAVAGKTGTASIPSAAGYDEKTIASMVGMVPYDQPKAVILVKIDNPKGSQWGSQVAAPVFSALAKELLVYWRVPPTEDAYVSTVR
ncbi:MAG: penicillin-binding protein 2 [Dehalococcoidia bacterium]|nr:penicillin-binding protein 2 [Dehalococcoidia bacterium]